MNGPLEDTSKLAVQQRRELLKRLLQERGRTGAIEYPLSPVQRGIWLLHRLAPESWVYNTASALRFVPPLDLDAFRAAMQVVVQTHDPLRTVFLSSAGVAIQRVLPEVDIPIEKVKAYGYSDDQFQRVLLATRQQPFDLEHGPPFRVHIFEREHEQVVLITIHHIVYDGWSFGVLFEDLRTSYESIFAGHKVEPRRIDARYRDYVTAQLQFLNSGSVEGALGFWRENLTPICQPLLLPYDYERPSVSRWRGSSLPLILEGELFSVLRAIAAAESTTVYVVLLAAYGAFLASESGQHQFVVGVPVSGRDQGSFEGLIGCFINMLPIKIYVSGTETFRQLVHSIRQRLLAAMRHSPLPMSHILECLHLSAVQNRHPIHQTTFNMFRIRAEGSQTDLDQVGAGGTVQFGRSRMSTYPIPQQEGLFDISVDLVASGERISGQFAYSTDLFRRETACLLRDRYLSTLATLLNNADERVARTAGAAGRDEISL